MLVVFIKQQLFMIGTKEDSHNNGDGWNERKMLSICLIMHLYLNGTRQCRFYSAKSFISRQHSMLLLGFVFSVKGMFGGGDGGNSMSVAKALSSSLNFSRNRGLNFHRFPTLVTRQMSFLSTENAAEVALFSW